MECGSRLAAFTASRYGAVPLSKAVAALPAHGRGTTAGRSITKLICRPGAATTSSEGGADPVASAPRASAAPRTSPAATSELITCWPQKLTVLVSSGAICPAESIKPESASLKYPGSPAAWPSRAATHRPTTRTPARVSANSSAPCADRM